ncbi:MAG: hypothetical protein JNL73_16935 [Anaerolineales bacterium]|nr:hypothetical protein [Anaerolineales bacterium]
MRRVPLSSLLWPTLLGALTLVIYAPSLGYGLIWDDPRWYGQAAGKTLTQLFFGLETYQFYRPLSLLLNQQFITADGRVMAGAAHAAQLAAHLAAVLLLAPALRALGLRGWHARLSALAFALYPAAFQAVAWQAPQGPWVLALVLGAVVSAGRFAAEGRARWLLATVGAYAAALLFQESALPLSVVVIWPAWRAQWPISGAWRIGVRAVVKTLRHARSAGLLTGAVLMIVGAYLAIWLSVPRDPNVTGEGRDLRVLAYSLQVSVWPIARSLAPMLAGWPALSLAAVFGALTLGLAGSLIARREPEAALLALTWILVGLFPPFVGLSWEYVSYGERLTYMMSPGMAVLWAGLGAWLIPAGPARTPSWSAWAARIVLPTTAALGLCAYAGLALAQLRDYRAVYAAGTRHLRAAIGALGAAPGQALLFVNFPDRYELRQPYYPLGFWGIVLAPVVQDLRDYAIAETGQSGVDHSLSAFVTGALERDAWPYRVDLRGVNAGPEGLVEAAHPAERVLLTEYLAGGALRLSDVGDIRADPGGPALAAFGDQLALRTAQLDSTGLLELGWAPLRAPGPDDALFIHIWSGGVFVADVGGDALGGLIPLWTWRPGDLIIDRRRLDLSRLAAGSDTTIRVGIYNRLTGERYPLVGAAGIDDAYVIERRLP